jgi:hypothetical protein
MVSGIHWGSWNVSAMAKRGLHYEDSFLKGLKCTSKVLDIISASLTLIYVSATWESF